MSRWRQIAATLVFVIAVFGAISWGTPRAPATSTPQQQTSSQRVKDVKEEAAPQAAAYTVASAESQPVLLVATPRSTTHPTGSSRSYGSTMALFAVGSVLLGLAAAVRRTT